MGKHAKLTQRAIEGLKREAKKAGRTLEEVLAECCMMGWQGFKASWGEKERKKSKAKEPDYSKVDYGKSRKL